ncbi:hypothetical protein [Phyllobacterium phragmitis]|uniref:TnsA endonuclease N-terminal domain-containing protein n=1 Tax=Phyllobacterium phragmitis TaxID=2670329 RepID=A0ABQ0GZ11_9HYPH
MLEANTAAAIEVVPGAVEIREQWPTVTYRGDGGGQQSHIFDFWVRMATGLRVAIAVKPASKVETSGLARTIELIREQGVLRPLADATRVLTEAEVSRGVARNARRILRARRMRNEAEVEAARRDLAGRRGWFRFADPLRGLPVEAHRRTALWNLIDEGFLVAREDGDIVDRSLVRVAPLPTTA